MIFHVHVSHNYSTKVIPLHSNNVGVSSSLVTMETETIFLLALGEGGAPRLGSGL